MADVWSIEFAMEAIFLLANVFVQMDVFFSSNNNKSWTFRFSTKKGTVRVVL